MAKTTVINRAIVSTIVNFLRNDALSHQNYTISSEVTEATKNLT